MTPNSGAFSAILNTVKQTANSATALVNTTTKGIGMLDAFVTKASFEQAAKHETAREVFLDNLEREASINEATSNIQAVEFCKQSPEHKALYDEAHGRFSKLLNKYRAKPSE